MSDLLGIGASGVFAYRAALAVVGDNVANSQTDGYARRDIKLRETVTTGSPLNLYKGKLSDGGVETVSITRSWDAFKASEARVSLSDNGRAEVRARWLAAAETALPDGDTGIGAKLTGVFTAADALAADPGNDTPRRAFLGAIDDATAALRDGAGALQRVSEGIAAEAKSTAATLNGDLAALARVNDSLRRVGQGGSAQASLFDQRDKLIDSIAANAAVDVKLGANGTAELTLAGSPGVTLLDGLGPATISTELSDAGQLSVSVAQGGDISVVQPTGGALAGLGSAASIVSDRRQQLNRVAHNFAKTINNWQAGGTTPAGVAGGPLIAENGGAAAIALVTQDPAKVAAAKDGKANGNLLTLQATRANGSEKLLAELVADQAQVIASAKAEASATATRRDNALASRDETSGVDLDREAADLLRYQQAYDGSARIIQVARETLQSILNLF